VGRALGLTGNIAEAFLAERELADFEDCFCVVVLEYNPPYPSSSSNLDLGLLSLVVRPFMLLNTFFNFFE
jgi:hypothetical protein